MRLKKSKTSLHFQIYKQTENNLFSYFNIVTRTAKKIHETGNN